MRGHLSIHLLRTEKLSDVVKIIETLAFSEVFGVVIFMAVCRYLDIDTLHTSSVPPRFLQ